MVLDTTDSSASPSDDPNPEDRFQPNFNGPPGQRFQTLLVSLGVARRWGGDRKSSNSPSRKGELTVAALAELSGVNRETWRRCASVGGGLCRLESVPAMGAALRACGRNITDEQLEEALLADLMARSGKDPSFRVTSIQSSASPADLMVSVIRGVPDEVQRDRFIRQVAAQLTTAERAAWVAAMFTPEVAQQGEASRDGNGRDGNNHDGNTSTDGTADGRTR